MQEKEAFIQVIKDNEGIIYKIAMVYAADREDLKDLYQEIVYQIWKSFKGFRSDAKVSTWIYRIALNTSIQHLNKRKKKGNQVPIDLMDLQIADDPDHLYEERMHLLRAQIKKLNVIEKSLVLLFLEGKSYEEMASITGFSASNVGTRLSRIKQKMKSQIKMM